MSFLTKEEALAEHTSRTWHEGFWWGLYVRPVPDVRDDCRALAGLRWRIMMANRLLLIAVAVALWLNLLTAWLRPAPVAAQTARSTTDNLGLVPVNSQLADIQKTLNLIYLDTGAMKTSLQNIERRDALRR